MSGYLRSLACHASPALFATPDYVPTQGFAHSDWRSHNAKTRTWIHVAVSRPKILSDGSDLRQHEKRRRRRYSRPNLQVSGSIDFAVTFKTELAVDAREATDKRQRRERETKSSPGKRPKLEFAV